MHPYVTAILTFFHKYQVRTGVVFISIVPLQVLQHMPFPAPSLSQLRGHIAGLSCPLCHRNFFNGEKRSAVPSLVDSRRSLACFEAKNQYVPGTAVVQIKKKIPGDQRISGDECIFFLFFFVFFSSIPFTWYYVLLSSPFYSLSLLLIVVTQIRSHIAGSSPPSPVRFVPCIFIARRFQLFLPSSTRVELSLPTLL